eukprot:774823-Pyramimonas_sp.AAC.3
MPACRVCRPSSNNDELSHYPVTCSSGEAVSGEANSGTVTWHAIAFESSTIGWIVGTSGKILRTTNGGRRWDKVINANLEVTGPTLYDVESISSGTAIVVGDSGTMLKTSDGGVSWVTLNSRVQDRLYSVAFISERTGWAAGSLGDRILFTSTGGSSWTFQNALGARQISVLSCKYKFCKEPFVSFCPHTTHLRREAIRGKVRFKPLTHLILAPVQHYIRAVLRALTRNRLGSRRIRSDIAQW